MTTPEQAAARAENGRKHSTGPKTPDGKRASSGNALTHGGYSPKCPVVRRGPLAEDPDAYEGFRAAVITSLDTVGPVEEELAATIANVMWRSRRPPAIEAIYLATAAESPYGLLPGQAQALCSRNEVAARVLGDPDGDHSAEDLEVAAIAAGHEVGLDMADDWPQPTPPDHESWNALIDTTLANKNRTREQAAAGCQKLAAEWKDRFGEDEAEDRDAEIMRIIDGELLTKTARVEAHLGRELSRYLGLLRAMQHSREAASE